MSSRLHDPPAAPPIAEVEGVFLALSHEARRHVILLLSQLGGELPSGYLAARFQHSWPTTTRHLKVLEEAGLVLTQKSGREKLHFLNPVPIRLIHDRWIDKYTEQRVTALADLKAALEAAARPDEGDPS